MASSKNKFKYKRKKVIVFAYEGKNNKTEKMYFSHFKPCDDDFILKAFSSGVTDIKNMIESTKKKRSEYDYHANEDLTYIFVDADGNADKLKLIKEYQKKQPKDIRIIVSNPTFEIWFLNHFVKTAKPMNNDALIKELKKYLNNYQKNIDYFDNLENQLETAISNSKYQLSLNKDNPFTEVVSLFDGFVIEDKES